MKYKETIREPFHGRNILITGGSRGIAATIARGLAHQGAHVVINYCAAADTAAGMPEAAQHLVQSIQESGGIASAIEQDLMIAGSGHKLIKKAEKVTGYIDSVVLSASLQRNIDFLFQTDKDIEQQIRVNITANIEILQAVLPSMASKSFGRILSIGSIQEVSPSAEMPLYALTKAGLKNLLENLAIQTAPLGITVNNLAPGLIATDRNEYRRKDTASWKKITESANPMGRAGSPEELLGTALLLLSENSSFITGSTLYATGGAHIPHPLADGRSAPLKLPEWLTSKKA